MNKKASDTKNKGKKILRLGLIQEGRILEEKLIRKPQDVTIGKSDKATFMVPLEGFPEAYKMFVYRKGLYYLRFTSRMQGKIAIQPGEVYTLAQLRSSNMVKRSKDIYYFELKEQTRGKVKLGDISILFQFIEAPKALPTYQPPAVLKGGLLTALDKRMFVAMVASILVHFAFMGFAYWWAENMEPEVEQEITYNKLVEFLQPEVQHVKKEKPVKIKAKIEKGKGTVAVKAKVGKVRRKHHGGGGRKGKGKSSKKRGKGAAISAAARHKKLVATVRSTTIIRYLGAASKDGSIIGSTIGKTGMARLSQDAVVGRKGVKNAKGNDIGMVGFRGGKLRAHSGGGSYAKLTGKELGGPLKTGRVARVKHTQHVAKVDLISNFMKMGGSGKIDKSTAVSVLRRARGGIKRCYDRALMKNPNLQGKLNIYIIVGPNGRVSDVNIIYKSFSYDPGFERCIKRKLRRLHFPKPKGGNVTLSIPLTLRP